MKFNVYDRLLGRELGGSSPRSNVKAIYGDRTWVRNLDIVNELDGHDGCVNALSWSKSGNLLASGSDDQRLNIHQYQADDTTKSFNLATTIQTGHTANIFSVKFMPHSNDQTLVSVAGDHQVRVFDIEYSSRSSSSVLSAGSLAAADRLQGFLHNGTRFLSPADTNARIYRSHGDRVKRIVTESSPHLFLTCSEDGEVRQWDLRQPSSAYPRPRDTEDGDSAVPPPLISYKKYAIDLNTISCSPSQPHYIALGGAHLHTFLHDRRMLGRDRNVERGQANASRPSTDHEDNMMGEATRCVKRFAPYGRARMKRSDNGHITACKISDANPNEMIASWSGDHIYSFDLIRSSDARDVHEQRQRAQDGDQSSSRAKHSRDRKRKRTKEGSVLSQEGTGRADSRPRTSNPSNSSSHAFRVQYANGQSEEIPIRESEEPQSPSLTETVASSMSESERAAYRIANTSVAIRKSFFTLGTQKPPNDRNPTGYATSFTSALGFCASILEDMDEVIKNWRYPLDPDDVEVVLQTTLKRNRESARRFVQAAGTISRVLGGQLWTGSNAQHPMINYFSRIVPAPNEANIIDDSERFRYDFVKAICLWLDSGPGALVHGFGRPQNGPRFPLSEDSGIDDIDEILIPYLLRLASDSRIPNVDTSRFEVDENRNVFDSEKAAVIAFANAIRIPFKDLSRPVDSTPSQQEEKEAPSAVEQVSTQDRRAALKFWGLKIARGLLLLAGEGVNHSYVDRAFGGLGNQGNARIRDDERLLRERLDGIDSEEEDPTVDSVQLTSHVDDESTNAIADDDTSEDVLIPADDVRAIIQEVNANASSTEQRQNDDTNQEDEDDEDVAEDDSDGENTDSEDDSDDEVSPESFIFRSAFSRSALRTKVNLDVPCSSHIRHYQGHCNVKTVKDVNFYGLNDEYVVSGSDSGHLFIWDKQSSQLLNILEGDGEVVNVVQGHPYEPMLAVSGIDHTVKIFSSDASARHNARHGIGVASIDASGFSSLRYGRTRFAPARRPPRNPSTAQDQTTAENDPTTTSEPAVPRANMDDSDSDEDGFNGAPKPVGPGGLSSRRRMYNNYAIISQNDLDRRGGQREAYITQSMLAQLASRVRLQMRRAHMAGQGGDGNEDGNGPGAAGGGAAGVTLQFEGGGSVSLGDDCDVM